AFAKVGFKVSTANVLDETAMQCDLVLPNLHSLERWDDLYPRAGVLSLMQPVMEPVRPGMHTGDVLLKASQAAGGALAISDAPTFEEHLRRQWLIEATTRGHAGGDTFWRESLAKGGIYEPAT